MDAALVKELEKFIDQCKANPSILSDPSLSFFRDYIESLGGKLPQSAYRSAEYKAKCQVVEDTKEDMRDDENEGNSKSAADVEEEPKIVESDIELDESDLVEPDNDPPQQMGDRSVKVTEESRDVSEKAKAQGMKAYFEGELDEAIEHLTKAILHNPVSSIMYAKRASVYVKKRKPNAALRDANEAIAINLDFAGGYKTRGMARAMLGLWEEAAKDLYWASTLDHDGDIDAALKKVESNVRKIKKNRSSCYERHRKERQD